MNNPEEFKKSILEMAYGAIMERVDYEMSKVIDNILDENTKATAPRVVKLEIKITPDENRQILQVNASADSKLAPTNAVATSLYISRVDGKYRADEMMPQIPGQRNFDGEEQRGPAMLRIVNAK